MDSGQIDWKSKMDSNDWSSLNIEFKNIFVYRISLGIAHKFNAWHKNSQKMKIIERCKLMDNKNQTDYDKLKNLNHLNLIKYDDILVENKFLYFISLKDYATELYDYLQNIKRSENFIDDKKASHYVCQIITAVQYLHSINILHSYLNSTDIYIYPDDFIKIGGFYFAEELTFPNPVSHVKERNLFFNCSPAEKSQLSFKYDYWSIGWIIYEICTFINMKNELAIADFENFNRPKIEKTEYKKLQDIYVNFTEIKIDSRTSLQAILNGRNFLGDQNTNQLKLFLSQTHLRRLNMVGNTIGNEKKFIIEEILGSGSYGVAFKCTDSSDNSTKALKMLSEMANESKQAKLLMELDHKNIAKCYAYEFINNRFYLLTEYCNAKNLEEYITKTINNDLTICNSRVLDWSRQLFDGLSYAHYKHIIHRDLKPANIMLDFDEQKKEYVIKLIDFGLSKKLNIEEYKASTCCGSPCYMAPEVFGQSYGFEADVWSAGCVIYELSELKKAFILEDNHNNMNILQVKIQNEKPKISDSNQMSEILNLIFVHDPNKRADSKTVFQKLKKMKADDN